MNKTRRYRPSFTAIAIDTTIHLFIVAGLSWLFCLSLALYTVRRATDGLFVVGFCYAGFALLVWVGRALRFYNQSGHFRNIMKVTNRDRPDFDPASRAWLLIVGENQLLVGWAVAGLIAMAVGVIIGTSMTAQFPPNTVLGFLVRPDLPPELRPGMWP